MTQTAEIYKFERPVVKADTSEGFIMLANSINAELGKFGVYKLNGRERALIDCIIEKTFGYKKKMDWISESQFAEFMGLSEGTKGNINKIKNGLVERKILIRDGRKVGINTTISEWVPFENQSKTTGSKTSQKQLLNQSKTTKQQSKTTEKAVKNDSHKIKEKQTRENITKEKAKPSVKTEVLTLELPIFLSFDLWKELVEHRIEIRKPFTLRAATMQLKQLTGWHAKGHDIEAIIQNSISNGYQGLFEPKTPPQRQNQSGQFSAKTQNVIDRIKDIDLESSC